MKGKPLGSVSRNVFLIVLITLLGTFAVVFQNASNVSPLRSSGETTANNGNVVQVAMTNGSWVWVRNTVMGAWGEAVVGTGDAIYVARKTSFYRYNPADNSWTPLEAPPNPDSGDAFKTGTALAWDFGDYIYALYGAATPDSRRWFYRYSISSNSWAALTNTAADQGEADAMTWVSIDNCIYATIGGEEERPTYFVRYDPSTNSWSNAPADPPGGMGDGASLVWTGGNFLYALRGEFYETSPLYDFWRYDLTANTWTAMADIPAYPYDSGVGGVGDGGSLLYVGVWLSNQTDYIYALSGNQAYPEKDPPVIPDKRFFRYTISTDSWERLTDLPFGVGYYVGCRLGYADGHIYAWQGTPSKWEGGGDDLAYYVFPAPEPECILEISSTIGGTTDPAPGTYTYSVGTEVTVMATPEENYYFDHWELDGENADSQNPIAITMDANHTLHAVFQEMKYTLTITSTAGGTTDPPAGTHSYIAGTTLNVIALPDSGFSFDYWSLDGEKRIENPITIVMDMNHTLIPYFVDDVPPEIGVPIQEPPENVMAYQNVTVTVNVTDHGAGVYNVTLWHSINNGTMWAPLNMTENSINTYQATIPGYENCTWITYEIIAYDNNGNQAINDNHGYYYIYHVIPEFRSFLIPPLFTTATLLAVIVYRRKNSM